MKYYYCNTSDYYDKNILVISTVIIFVFQIVADHLITSSGIRPILHCFAVEAIMEGHTIKVHYSIVMNFIGMYLKIRANTN